MATTLSSNKSSVKFGMPSSPAPFSDIGKRVKDVLTKDYNFDNKFILTIPSDSGLLVTAAGSVRDQIFVGDISTQYKSSGTTVDVKVDTCSNVSTTVTVNEIVPSTKAALSFKIPDHKSVKLDLQYLHHHATINSSIGLTPSPFLEFAAAIGSKQHSLGGEVGFDTSTASFTKYNVGIGLNTPDLSAALVLADKGETLKLSFIQSVPINGSTIAAEMTHKFTTYENTFTFGSSHAIDPSTLIKARISNNGIVGVVCQREWRPKSHITFSAEYDSKAISAPPRLGLAVALKP
ncbi:hypothetical protein IFM89_006134 [Coptis chinensis]|uniref:Uncharacterized protein n=1 Tax=Coptis chinensis TaxID=261450 RepID=A0A835GWN9_9MAGN|nr:hypothetical protein IFM89_006134 [Coptis chinensis]